MEIILYSIGLIFLASVIYIVYYNIKENVEVYHVSDEAILEQSADRYASEKENFLHYARTTFANKVVADNDLFLRHNNGKIVRYCTDGSDFASKWNSLANQYGF